MLGAETLTPSTDAAIGRVYLLTLELERELSAALARIKELESELAVLKTGAAVDQ